MHGTGLFVQLATLCGGGATVTLRSRSFDVEELFDTIERERVNTIAIVGDAFAVPMLRALDAHPDRWDLTSLVRISSSGVMWSEPTKRGLLDHLPAVTLSDTFSSSEAIGMGQAVSTGGAAAATARFSLGAGAIAITDDAKKVEPGSGVVGRVAVGGIQPLGYYKDDAKTAATFITIDGQTYSEPGDYARVEADGTLTLLGRGSVCINTAGEKVFPEEVEEVLKTHVAIADAAVVGVPDAVSGEAVVALVEPAHVAPGADVDAASVIAHVKANLAGYKAPKRVLVVDSVQRGPNGKLDYARLRARAIDALSLT